MTAVTTQTSLSRQRNNATDCFETTIWLCKFSCTDENTNTEKTYFLFDETEFIPHQHKDPSGKVERARDIKKEEEGISCKEWHNSRKEKLGRNLKQKSDSQTERRSNVGSSEASRHHNKGAPNLKLNSLQRDQNKDSCQKTDKFVEAEIMQRICWTQPFDFGISPALRSAPNTGTNDFLFGRNGIYSTPAPAFLREGRKCERYQTVFLNTAKWRQSAESTDLPWSLQKKHGGGDVGKICASSTDSSKITKDLKQPAASQLEVPSAG